MNINDGWIAATLGLATFLLVFLELGLPGVTWDEAHPNFPAAKNQAAWFQSLLSLDHPFAKETIDKYWETTSDHPSLPRTIAAFSFLLFDPFFDEITALRIPSAVSFSLLVGTIFLFLRLFLPRMGALAGAGALVMMPRIFGHAHLFSLDIPIMCWWFWAAIMGYLVLEKEWKPWWFGLMYAIAFTTKLHAVFLPFPLLAWGMLQCGGDKQKWKRLGWAVAWGVILTPIIYILLQPWLWHDTWLRIAERFFDYAEKSTARPIRLFYLGELYTNNTPWHYPLVMLALTWPVCILGFILMGLGNLLWKKNEPATFPQWAQWQGGVHVFLLLLFLTPLMLVLLPLAQGYDGCRLFLPCFPFAACIAGFGYSSIHRYLSQKASPILLHAGLILLLVVPSLMAYAKIRPFYLAYYNELAGGVAGAHEMGMETTYWCDALTRDLLEEINATVQPGQTMRPLSMAYGVIDYYKERGWLRPDIDHLADPPYDFHLLQSRQGMFTQVEWFLHKQRKPLAANYIGKVPLFALYGELE